MPPSSPRTKRQTKFLLINATDQDFDAVSVHESLEEVEREVEQAVHLHDIDAENVNENFSVYEILRPVTINAANHPRVKITLK